MFNRIILSITILTLTLSAYSQEKPLNQTDKDGKKQGQWIKLDEKGNKEYQGLFADNHPVGEFLRYYPDGKILSVMNFSPDGKNADTKIFYQNGFLASEGKYINQLKEGNWKFFSVTNGSLIAEENYSKNIKNGMSVKYYPDSTLAEKGVYKNDLKEGEWIQYHENGKLMLKANYKNGELDGKLESWFFSGKPQYQGLYVKNKKEGPWKIYKPDGTLRYEILYNNGITNDKRLDIDATDFMDNLEKNKDKVLDPEKSGVIR